MGDITAEQRAAKAAYMREWRLRPENHERVKAQQREKYLRERADPLKVERKRQLAGESYRRCGGYQQTWNAKNPDKAREYRKAWDERNPGKSNAAYRRWYERNKVAKAARLAGYQVKRQAMKRGAGIFVVTDRDYRRILNGRCHYCDAPATEVDHLVPVSRGGRHAIGNLVGACRSCNASKNNRTVMEWRLNRRAPRAA